MADIGHFPVSGVRRCIALVPSDVLANLITRISKSKERAVYSFGRFRETSSTSGLQRAYSIRVNSQLSVVPMGQHVEILAHTAPQAHRRIRFVSVSNF